MYLFKRIGKLKRVSAVTVHGRMSKKFKNELYKYEDVHNGQKCFVVGNGPSLNKIDMSLLGNEITFGSNRVYLGFEKWGFNFKYWGIEDFLQIKQGYKEFSRNLHNGMIKFIPRQYCYLFKCKNICPVNFLHKYENYPQFSGSSDVLYLGYSVTYMLLQIAVVMGCNPIYLIGVDYSYNITKKEMKDGKWSDSDSKSHFTNNYCSTNEGRIWNLPRFDKTDPAFKCAANWAEQKAIQILNATPRSKLTFFPKVDYGKIFK